jgi:hypothetical protein
MDLWLSIIEIAGELMAGMRCRGGEAVRKKKKEAVR